MTTTQTIWVLQWERYTAMAKTQDAPAEFWEAYRKIQLPAQKQITQSELEKLKDLMKRFKLEL